MSASTADASEEAAAEGTQPGDSTSSGSDSDVGQNVDIEVAAVPETTAATAAPDAAAHAAPALPTEARCLLLQCPLTSSHCEGCIASMNHSFFRPIAHGGSCFSMNHVRPLPAFMHVRACRNSAPPLPAPQVDIKISSY